MKAAFIRAAGGPDVFEYGDLPDPKPGPGEALVKVRACALNHIDIWVRSGSPAYPVKFPHIMGSDVSGEVASLPAGYKGPLKVGSPVMVAPGIPCGECAQCKSGNDNQCPKFKILGAMVWGGYAERMAVPVKNIFPKPDHLSYEEASALPLTFLTAWHMLAGRARLAKGEWVLVLGASSGVGSAAIQIAKGAGATVIAVSSSTDKLAGAKKLGADFVVDGSKEDFAKKARELTEGRGVDVVLEHVGPATWEKSMRSLAARGRLVTCGATTGPIVQLDLRFLFSKDLTLMGARLGTRAEFEKLLEWVKSGKIKPVVSKVFPLQDARKAHEFLEGMKQFGKVVLKVG